MEYLVRGNTVLPASEIQRLLDPYLGPSRTVSDVEAAQQALEGRYRELGYVSVTVDVPPQDARDAVIELVVSEGRIGRVRVEGADYVLPSRIRSALPDLQEGAVPHVPTLQAQLREANSRPGRTIEPRFRAGAAPGTVDIDLLVEDERPWRASAEVNDQFNRATQRLRLNLSASYDNLWQRGHSANVFYQTAPEDVDQIQVWSASYFAPLGYSRTSLLGYFVDSNTDVATVNGLAVIGEGLNIGARVIHTLQSDRPGVVHSLLAGVDYKDFTDEIGLTTPEGEALTFETPIDYLPFTFQYRFLMGRPNATHSFELGSTFGFDGVVGEQLEFGGRPDDPLTVRDENALEPGKRAGSEASFIYFYGAYRQERRLPWELTLTGEANFQYAAEPLISNEQFALGGLSSVRGYREAEALADSGVRLSVQLARDLDPFLARAVAADADWSVYVFADGAIGMLNDPLLEEEDEFVLGSIGLGTQFSVLDAARLRVDAAYQFSDDPSGSGSDVVDDVDEFRIHFSLGVEY